MTIYSFRPVVVLAVAVIAFLGCTMVLWRATREQDWRRSVLTCYIIWGVFVWLFSEMLSLFDLISFNGIAISWVIGIICILSFFVRKGGGSIQDFFRRPFETYRLSNSFDSMMLKIMGACLVLIVCTLSLIAIVAAPNNWDSMTYHLARVMHWQQNQDIYFYPTHILRQLHSAPWAEMAILHLQILSGNDRLANFVQLFAMIGCLIGTSYIAKLFGGDNEVQLFSSLAVATIPMGILQSTSTQNDYVAALWLVCFVSFAMVSIQEQKLAAYLLAGISLGLALLTKPTASIFAAPFLVWMGLALLKKLRGAIWKPVLVIASAILLINSGFTARNLSLYGNPLDPMEETTNELRYKYTNDTYNLGTVTSNVLRNIMLQIGTPFDGFNDLLTEIIENLHTILGLNPNDPRNTWFGSTFSVGHLTWHEDVASNPWHFLIIVISLLLLLRFRNSQARLYAASLLAGFVLFSLLLKWQPWHSRLLLPLSVLAMPLSMVVLSHYIRRRIVQSILVLFILLALQPLLTNKSRPIFGEGSIFIEDRISQYFMNQPGLETPYRKAMAHIPVNCSRIGLLLEIDGWEYPIWILGKVSGQYLTVEHVKVENVSKKYTDLDFKPCAIFATTQNTAEQITLNGEIYLKKFEKSPISVFVPLNAHTSSPK